MVSSEITEGSTAKLLSSLADVVDCLWEGEAASNYSLDQKRGCLACALRLGDTRLSSLLQRLHRVAVVAGWTSDARPLDTLLLRSLALLLDVRLGAADVLADAVSWALCRQPWRKDCRLVAVALLLKSSDLSEEELFKTALQTNSQSAIVSTLVVVLGSEAGATLRDAQQAIVLKVIKESTSSFPYMDAALLQILAGILHCDPKSAKVLNAISSAAWSKEAVDAAQKLLLKAVKPNVMAGGLASPVARSAPSTNLDVSSVKAIRTSRESRMKQLAQLAILLGLSREQSRTATSMLKAVATNAPTFLTPEVALPVVALLTNAKADDSLADVVSHICSGVEDLGNAEVRHSAFACLFRVAASPNEVARRAVALAKERQLPESVARQAIETVLRGEAVKSDAIQTAGALLELLSKPNDGGSGSNGNVKLLEKETRSLLVQFLNGEDSKVEAQKADKSKSSKSKDVGDRNGHSKRKGDATPTATEATASKSSSSKSKAASPVLAAPSLAAAAGAASSTAASPAAIKSPGDAAATTTTTTTTTTSTTSTTTSSTSRSKAKAPPPPAATASTTTTASASASASAAAAAAAAAQQSSTPTALPASPLTSTSLVSASTMAAPGAETSGTERKDDARRKGAAKSKTAKSSKESLPSAADEEEEDDDEDEESEEEKAGDQDLVALSELSDDVESYGGSELDAFDDDDDEEGEDGEDSAVGSDEEGGDADFSQLGQGGLLTAMFGGGSLHSVEKARKPARSQQARQPRPQTKIKVVFPKLIWEGKDVLVLNKPADWICSASDVDKKKGRDLDPNEKCANKGFKVLDDLLTYEFADREKKYIHWWIQLYHNLDTDGYPNLFDEDQNYGLCHRLDRETSGTVLVGVTQLARQQMRECFHRHYVRKLYVCLAHGFIEPMEQTVDKNIEAMGQKAKLHPNGKRARTHVKVLAQFTRKLNDGTVEEFSLCTCEIAEGRMHQIRLHMSAALNSPIVSEFYYQGQKQMIEDRRWCQRVFLHAYAVGFPDVSGEKRRVGATEEDELDCGLKDETKQEWHCCICPLTPELRASLECLEPKNEESKELLETIKTTGLLDTMHKTSCVIGTENRKGEIDDVFFPWSSQVNPIEVGDLAKPREAYPQNRIGGERGLLPLAATAAASGAAAAAAVVGGHTAAAGSGSSVVGGGSGVGDGSLVVGGGSGRGGNGRYHRDIAGKSNGHFSSRNHSDAPPVKKKHRRHAGRSRRGESNSSKRERPRRSRRGGRSRSRGQETREGARRRRSDRSRSRVRRAGLASPSARRKRRRKAGAAAEAGTPSPSPHGRRRGRGGRNGTSDPLALKASK